MKTIFEKHLENQNYINGFIIISFLVIFLSIFFTSYKFLLLIPYFIYTLFAIINFHKKGEENRADNTYKKRGMQLSLTILISSTYVMIVIEPLILPIMYPALFIIFLYNCIQYLGNQVINYWWKYSLFFLFLPLTSIPIAFFFVMAFDSLGPISNRLLITTSILVSLLIPIILCIIVESKLLHELKVAIYFWLGLITTFSAITFLVAPYLEQELLKFTTENLTTVESELKEIVGVSVEYFLNVALLPYVISAAWCCFIVELREKINRSKMQSVSDNSQINKAKGITLN